MFLVLPRAGCSASFSFSSSLSSSCSSRPGSSSVVLVLSSLVLSRSSLVLSSSVLEVAFFRFCVPRRPSFVLGRLPSASGMDSGHQAMWENVSSTQQPGRRAPRQQRGATSKPPSIHFALHETEQHGLQKGQGRSAQRIKTVERTQRLFKRCFMNWLPSDVLRPASPSRRPKATSSQDSRGCFPGFPSN